MIEVIRFDIEPTYKSLAKVIVRYFDLMLYCELCVYKNESLWVRMPEIWTTPKSKKSFVSWVNQDKSDEFQKVILKKLFDMVGFTLSDALRIRKGFFKKKRMTLKKEKLILSEKKLQGVKP